MRDGISSRQSTPLQYRCLCILGASCLLATLSGCATASSITASGNANTGSFIEKSAQSTATSDHGKPEEPVDDHVKLARYSTAAAEPLPDADDPLSVIAHIQFPRTQVTTVGQAVRYLLLRTGYSLVDTSQLDPSAAHLLTLPLPESDRELGTYRVRAMLAVLVGKPFTVHANPVNRTVSFVPASSALASVQGTAQ